MLSKLKLANGWEINFYPSNASQPKSHLETREAFRDFILAALEKVIQQSHIGGSLANCSLGDLATDLAHELEK